MAENPTEEGTPASPLPWRLRADRASLAPWITHCCKVIDANGYEVAHTHEYVDETFAENSHMNGGIFPHFKSGEPFPFQPNAALIVEAVNGRAELIDALTLVELHFRRNHASGNFQGDDEHEAWTAVRAALAKTEAH
jgi:hypothetical protein